jgi:hypothetical protein
VFKKYCIKEKITNLLTDKLITIMVFVQFCDIKNLANFSQKLAKIDEFTLLKNPNFSQFFCWKNDKICQLKKTLITMANLPVFARK